MTKKNVAKFKILKFLIVILIFAFYILNFKEAEAAFIIQRPLYLGLSNGLVGNWSFDAQDMAADGNNTTAYDRSGQGNNGTLRNMSTSTSRVIGKLGQALSFDGTDDNVAMGDKLNFVSTDPITISAWQKQNAINPTTGETIIGKYDGTTNAHRGWWFGVQGAVAGDPYRFGLVNDNSPLNALLADFPRTNDTSWHHVVVTYDGSGSTSGVRGFEDGIEKSVTSISNNLSATIATAVALKIGDITNDTTNRFSGSIDDVRIYNRALSGEEIKRLYKIGATAKINTSINTGSLQNGLVGSWSFDAPTISNSTNNVLDLSGQGNTGKMMNMSTSTSRVIGKLGQALSFDGTDDYVRANSNITFGDTMTLSAWVKLNTLAASQRIIGVCDDPDSACTGGNYKVVSLMFYTTNGSLAGLAAYSNTNTRHLIAETSGTNLFSINTWYHVVATYTYSANTMNLYINGVSQGLQPTTCVGVTCKVGTGGETAIGERVAIGTLYDVFGGTSIQPFNGSIDDVRIYNRALSGEEIKRLYKIGATAKINTSINTGSLQNGLVGAWSFDAPTISNSTNNVLDVSGQGNTGKMMNMSTSTSRVIGRIGQALSFDGTDDYVRTGNMTFDNVGTFSMWIKLNTINQYHSIGVCDDPDGPSCNGGNYKLWLIYITSSNKLELILAYSNWNNRHLYLDAANSSFVAGRWYHIAGVWNYSANTGNLYIDGVDQVLATGTNCDGSACITGSGGEAAINEAIDIGATYNVYNNSNATFFNGSIDDVRIYNRALSGEEIKRLYNIGR